MLLFELKPKKVSHPIRVLECDSQHSNIWTYEELHDELMIISSIAIKCLVMNSDYLYKYVW